MSKRAVMYGPHSTWSSSAGFKLLDKYARNLPGVERLSIFEGDRTVHSYINGKKIASSLKRTDDEFWKILEFSFLEGGPYGAADVAEARFVAVINATTRQRFFDGRPALGQTLEADGQRFRVIGVVEDVSELRRLPTPRSGCHTRRRKPTPTRASCMGGWNAMALAQGQGGDEPIHDEFNSRLLRAELPDPKHYQAIVAPFETKFAGFRPDDAHGDREGPG